MRWLLFVLLAVGIALTFTAKSAGLLGVGLVLGFIGFFGLIFALAADRVSASSRPETSMLGAEDLAAMRARQTGARPRAVAPAAARPVAAPPAAPARPAASSRPPPPANGAAS